MGVQTSPHSRSWLLRLFSGKGKGHISDFRCLIFFSDVSAWGSLGKIGLAFWWFLILLHKWCTVCHKTETSTSTSADSLCLFPFPWVSALPGVCTGLMGQVNHCHVLLCPSSKHNPAFSISRYCQNQVEAPTGAFSLPLEFPRCSCLTSHPHCVKLRLVPSPVKCAWGGGGQVLA